MHLELFLLRQKGTEKYIPARKGRGGSHDEPVETKTPRIFTSLRAAVAFRGQWKLGAVTVRRSGDIFDYEEDVQVKHLPHRDTLDLEVVTLYAREVL